MNAVTGELRDTPVFLPRLRVDDANAEYWLSQIALRLRREICWLWRERGMLSGVTDANKSATLPPFTDRLSGVLDLMRYERDKQAFFINDTTARYLSDLINVPAPQGDGIRLGSFSRIIRELDLAPAECFALALALMPVIDSAAGTVFAACLNDATKTSPTLALAQRLWETPESLLPLVGSAHPLARHGLLYPPPREWDAPLVVNTAVAAELLNIEPSRALALRPVEPDELPGTRVEQQATLLAGRLRAATADGNLRIVPLLGPRGAPFAGTSAALAAYLDQTLLTVQAGARAADLPALMTLAWLRDAALYLPFELLTGEGGGINEAEPIVMPLQTLPLTLFIGVHHRSQLKRLSASSLLPAITLPPLDYHGRLAAWRRYLPGADNEFMHEAMSDCARRFHYERGQIENICASLGVMERDPVPADLVAACRADLELGELAQPVEPRFTLKDLMLPSRQASQIDELIRAMFNVSRVHYEWGTARAWGEGGLSALFCGAPGTGKTMAAEVIAAELDMPMYRIDLSQVVNKYIGETEKNLRRLFDSADTGDVILFFDEADALFGKRTEVRDAHDRYANLEVSYLLERMERFKGLAILATNRRKDLDEAFMRRLRFAIEFPLPDVKERLRIWQNVIPPDVDASSLDLPFLAEHFALAGGHIRSIVFHACLQSGGLDMPRRLAMPDVLHALCREYDKLNRVVSAEQFGPYAQILREMT